MGHLMTGPGLVGGHATTNLGGANATDLQRPDFSDPTLPVSYRIDPTAGVVFSVWEGDVTLAEAVQHNDALRSDPAFHPGMNQLSDARLVTSTVTAKGIRALAQTSPFGRGSRRAIVAQTDLVFGVSRQYALQTKGDGGEVMLFKDMQFAIEWLGLDMEAEKPA